MGVAKKSGKSKKMQPKGPGATPAASAAPKLPLEKIVVDGFTYWPAEGRKSARIFLSGALEDIFSYDDDVPVELVAFRLVSEPALVAQVESVADGDKLLELCRSCMADSQQAYNDLKANGLVSWRFLPLMLPVGTEVWYHDGIAEVGGVVLACRRVDSFFGPYYEISIRCFGNHKGLFVDGYHDERVYAFNGAKPPSAISIQVMTPEKKAEFAARGARVVESMRQPLFQYMDGVGYQQGWFGDLVPTNVNGRVVADFACATAEDALTGPWQWRRSDQSSAKEISQDKLWCVYPGVPVYSIQKQRWYLATIENLTDIKFNDSSFDKLVLDQDLKDMIRCLSAGVGNSFADFIDQKGGGAIFLLHGPPGTGKTSLAEVTAESLHRPLCTIGAADLGTDAVTLEQGLTKFLRRAERWGAVLLIDEADVFMEARTSTDIERNALVSVFLRTLEYYSGVMFLTTNRVKGFDHAFFSRISVAVEYTEMTSETRAKVWHNLLAEAKVEISDLVVKNALKDIQINGRQIKNAIRMASIMAKSAGRAVTVEDLTRFTQRAASFDKVAFKP